jgi:hypothetical protein
LGYDATSLEDRHLSAILEFYKNSVRLAGTFVPKDSMVSLDFRCNAG